MTPQIKMSPRFPAFFAEYENAVRTCHAAGAYSWSASEMDAVLAHMRTAFERGSYNHDGPAMKAACKAAGVKHTFGAIELHIRGYDRRTFDKLTYPLVRAAMSGKAIDMLDIPKLDAEIRSVLSERGPITEPRELATIVNGAVAKFAHDPTAAVAP